MRAAIAKQRDLLDSLDALPPEAFATLPSQLLHGDFHDHQVLWDETGVVAVVDWELWRSDPRVWELIRSLAFSQLLGEPGMDEYLSGYRRFVQLSEEECRLGMRLWWQSRVVGVWVWAAYFLQGNERVLKFIPDVIAELDHVADDAWKHGIEERFVRAACG
jgi:Ser/Thr protein kinase RdoA (MazF antagonist)